MPRHFSSLFSATAQHLREKIAQLSCILKKILYLNFFTTVNVPVPVVLLYSQTKGVKQKYILWRIVRVAPTSAPTGVRTLAARRTSVPEAQVLTTGPPVVPYASVIGAGLSST